MNASSTRWPLRHYGWIVARFLLFSGAVFLLWPALAPAYVALIGFLMRPLLLILGPSPSVYDQLGEVPGRHGNRSPNNDTRQRSISVFSKSAACCG